MILRKIKKKTSKYSDYLKYCNESIMEKLILLEAGQGKNINGNIFAFVKELSSNQQWHEYKLVLIVTEDTIDKAKKRLSFYQFKDIKLVIRNTSEYQYYLAVSKYLITDNSFPPYFHKRDGQIYLNTWHGTPLKILGISDIKNSTSLANVQKNYLMCDYALFPNYYTYNIFMEDYSLKNILKNKILLCDYPRNVSFYDEKLKKEIILKYNLNEKRIYAYMPTWRGSSRNANIKKQKDIIINYLKQIDRVLLDNEILYVNLHFLIGNDIDLSQFNHIELFPQEYETYDFLNVCDVLITDYSSVFFDFAVTRKKIVLFTYDLQEYIEERGMYFSIEELPFPIVKDVDNLVKELHNSDFKKYDDFYDKYCAFSQENTTKNILELLILKKKNNLIIEEPVYNGKKNVFIHINKVLSKHQVVLLNDYFKSLSNDKNYICTFNGKITPNVVKLVDSMPKNIQVFAYVSNSVFSFSEYILNSLAIRSKFINFIFNKKVSSSLSREAHRLFYNIRIDEIRDFIDTSNFMPRIFNFMSIKKEFIDVFDFYIGARVLKQKYKLNKDFMIKNYDKVVKWNGLSVDDENKETFYNLTINFVRIFSKIRSKDGFINYYLCFAHKNNLPKNIKFLNIIFGDKNYKVELKHPIKKGTTSLNYLKVSIPKSDIPMLNIQNKLYLSVIFDDGLGIKKGIKYDFVFFRKKTFKHSRILSINEKTCAYFRRSANNFIFLTVRTKNKTDGLYENFKLNVAYLFSKLIKNKHVVLLFEKDSSRYEESASVVYEKLIDMNIKDVYFIIDRESKDVKNIGKRYRKNIIFKYTFKHYLYFFICRTFIGTEALIHVIELRAINKHVLQKVNDKKNDYIFLQHGVMYMISLDSESRTFFRPRSVHAEGKYRVVVSSYTEASHFIELGHYDESQVIISGLPKYDKNQWYDNADKIIIMPTWRPWEYNGAAQDFSNTKYYQMIERIFYAIPEDYRDKIVILPHPLFFDAAKDVDFILKKYMNFDVQYDLILREAKILITDYSSIAYDAFYRGANVIFYWEELQECLQYYGKSTKLMLNKNNVFGDVCYNCEDLKNVIRDNYLYDQKEQYQLRYKGIVAFDDNKNTERLVNALLNEKIIDKSN